MNNHLQLWNDFCRYHAVLNGMRPLLATEKGLKVKTRQIGKNRPRTILCRSAEMEVLIREEGAKLVDDWQQKTFKYDGLIYMMLVEGEQGPVPLYIGKTETLGKGNGNLSVNIKGLATNTANFARWGDNYAYHIGDLSAVALPGHDSKKANPKYKDWAACLFEEYPSANPILKRQVYFWTKAWSSKDSGPWIEFGPTSLTFLEYLLIGLASSAFGNILLNREGRNKV